MRSFCHACITLAVSSLFLSVASEAPISCGQGSFISGSGCLACPSGKFGDGSATSCDSCAKGFNSIMGSGECLRAYPLRAIGVNTLPDVQGGFDNSAIVRALNLTQGTSTPLTVLPEPPRCFAMSVTGRFAIFGGLAAVIRLDIPTNVTRVVAGSLGQPGFADSEFGAQVRFNTLGGMYLSKDETFVLVSDTNNNRIRKAFLNGTVITLAGGGMVSGEESNGQDAMLWGPTGITVSADEKTVVFIEKSARRIRRMDLTGGGNDVRVAPLVGNAAADPQITYGIGTAASFHTIQDVVFTPDGRSVLVSETDVPTRQYPSLIRRVDLSTQNVSLFFSSKSYAMMYLTFAYTDNTFLWVNAGSPTFGVTYPSGKQGLTQSEFQERMRIAKAECRLAGYTLDGTSDGYSKDTCSQCPPGKYNVGSGLFTEKCTACPANSYALAGSDQCTANVGYYMVMRKIEADPYNYPPWSYLVFNNNNLSTAVSARSMIGGNVSGASFYVPSHTFSPCARINCSSTVHCSSFGRSPVCCGQQTFFLEGILESECRQCPLGSVSSGAGSSCQTCAAGQFINATTCTDCAAGSYSPVNHGSACTLCPAGTYSGALRASSSTVCLSCPPGTYQPAAGASSRAACVDCAAGKYQSRQGAVNGCVMCAAGTYQPGMAGSVCIACENSNAWSLDGATACVCKAGYTTVQCTACAAGTYKEGMGDRVCVECPSNSFCPAAATAPALCPVNTQSPASSASSAACLCRPGFTGPDCAPCAPGTFKGDTGPHSCLQCPANAYCPAAANATTPCPASPPHLVAPPGSANSSACECDAGFAGPACDPVLNVAVVAGAAAGGFVLLLAASLVIVCRRGAPVAGGGAKVKSRFTDETSRPDVAALLWRPGYSSVPAVHKS